MPPKKSTKGQKLTLNEFLGDSALGSWADEMDALPDAPAVKRDDDRPRGGDRFGRRDDFLSTRPDRAAAAPREDLPLPTQPPYTAFIGNLPFDLSESDIQNFFGGDIVSIKIIKDRDDKPKGFGYVEFSDLDGLKAALEKSGSTLLGRTIRTSVAEPPKERAGPGGGFEDSAKFDNPWRREGPLPDLQSSRDTSRRSTRLDAPPAAESASEGVSDWRANRPARAPPADTEPPPARRRGSGFGSAAPAGAADTEDVWTKGSRFKPTEPQEQSGSKFGPTRSHSGGLSSPREPPTEEGDWRSRPRGVPSSSSPNGSAPPTPQLGRKKLELLPRSGGPSVSPSPVSSPKMAPAAAVNAPRANPFGAARPVDVSGRENEVTQRIEKERETRTTHSMSRTDSRSGTDRSRGPPPATSTTSAPAAPAPSSPRVFSADKASVRPSFSFANAAAGKSSESNTDTAA